MQLYLTLSMHRPKCKNIENRNLLPKNCLTPKHWLCVRSGENVWGVLPCWPLAVPPWLLMMVGKFNQSSINLHNTNDDTVRQEPASLTCQTNSGTQYTQHSTPPRKLQLGQQHTHKKPQIIPTFKTLKPLKPSHYPCNTIQWHWIYFVQICEKDIVQKPKN